MHGTRGAVRAGRSQACSRATKPSEGRTQGPFPSWSQRLRSEDKGRWPRC